MRNITILWHFFAISPFRLRTGTRPAPARRLIEIGALCDICLDFEMSFQSERKKRLFSLIFLARYAFPS